MLRIGHGYDVHVMSPGRKCIIGGVTIPYEYGPDGHSDADVLVHAVCDSLLGALALGDIGLYFPDTDERYKDADSLVLLGEVIRMIRERGFHVGNIDCTVICQRPKLRGYIDDMRKNIAGVCGVDTGMIGIKATTEEGLGFTGSGEGIAAHAVCIISDEK